jgi:hypothetical protein
MSIVVPPSAIRMPVVAETTIRLDCSEILSIVEAALPIQRCVPYLMDERA